jgi:hypothetical protein
MLSRSERDAYQRAIQSLMRPIVRQLVAKGLPYSALDGIVRRLYVETAERDFALPFKRPTDSRVSLVTGLHRKEVARLRREKVVPPSQVGSAESIASRVIGRWMAARGYVDERQRPRAIPYEQKSPRGPSLVRLVQDLGIDIPPRSVLDELIRLGAVVLLPGGDLKLREEGLIPSGNLEQRLPILANDPGELFTTIAHNFDEPETPWFQRKVDYDNIGSDSLLELRQAAKAAGEEFIRVANALLAGRDRDRNKRAPGGRRSRVVMGAYYFESDAEPGLSAARLEDAPVRPKGRGERRGRKRPTKRST